MNAAIRELADVVVVRGLLPPRVMADLCRAVRFAYTEIDRRVAAGTALPDDATAHKWGGLALRTFKREFHGDQVLAPVVERIQARFPGARMVDECSAFRRIVPDKSTYIYWHLDADGTGSFAQDPAYNCWLPFETVGTGDYPSLEILDKSEKFMRSQPLLPGYKAHRPDEWVNWHFPDAVPFCPRLDPGDAVVFSHYLLHRTQPMATLKGERIGAELRFSMAQPPGLAARLKRRVVELVRA